MLTLTPTKNLRFLHTAYVTFQMADLELRSPFWPAGRPDRHCWYLFETGHIAHALPPTKTVLAIVLGDSKCGFSWLGCPQVRNLLHKRIQNMYLHPQFQTDVIKPLRIDELMDQEVQHLSGGELQRVAITMCLGKEADLYLIDEPSAYLDSEQRIIAAKVCKLLL